MTANHPLELLARSLELRAEFSLDDREAILRLPYSLKTLDPSTYTVLEGEPPETCAVILSGFAYRFKTTANGNRQIVSLQIPGDALDFQNLFLDRSDHNIQMLTRGEVALIPRAALQQLIAERTSIARAVLVKILVEASIFREWVLNVGRRNAREATAHLLCEFAKRLASENLAPGYAYELPMSQEQLGDALGLTPVHVNRTLKRLEADGLIKRDQRFISFPDWRRLQDVAGFDPGYLHLAPQQTGLAT